MAGQIFIPPVQPVPTAPNTIGGNAKPKPNQQEGAPKEGTCPDCAKLTILTGALVEVLITKELLSEEEVLNAIAELQSTGSEGMEKAPEGGKANGGGYPGAADTQRGTGGENGKMSPSRQ